MKNKLLAASLLIALSSSAIAQVPPQLPNQVYRFFLVRYNWVIFETTNLSEGSSAAAGNGMNQAIGGWMPVAGPNERQPSGTIPIYRCLVRGTLHHFPSPRSDCEGHINESMYGYVSQYPMGSYTEPLVRYFDPNHLSHMAATSCGYQKTVRKWLVDSPPFSFYRAEGILGYVMPGSSC